MSRPPESAALLRQRRVTAHQHHAELIVAKNRNNGRVGLAKVMFARDLNRFGDFIPERFRSEVA